MPDETDIDGDSRVLFGWVDIGADELSENRAPVADAGPDQTYSIIPSLVTLDGSGSYDLNGDGLAYNWQQIDGPEVVLSDDNAVNPTFEPLEFGIYVFELIVDDQIDNSIPDRVGVVIGNNHAPIADAGPSRYAGAEPIVLDGTGSYDPDGYGEFTYQSQQVSGPAVVITDADTATPTISGFTQTSAIQECEFELVVSDGDLTSQPDVVKVIIVPSFSGTTLVLENSFFNPDKPTLIYFSGGSGGSPMGAGPLWEEKANIISFSTPHNGGGFAQHGNAIISYLSSKAPSYNQKIQTTGASNGGKHPAAVGAYINTTYADSRYNVNQATLWDAHYPSQAEIEKFLNSSVGGEQSWVANYRAGPYSAYPGPEIPGALNVYFPLGKHGTPAYWYVISIESYNLGWIGDVYNGGIVAGAYLSVVGEGKNLELAPYIGEIKYYFEWVGDNYGPGYLDFYDEVAYPGRLPEPVTLIEPTAVGSVVGFGGAFLTCEESENAIGYQLLVGSDPYRVMDYTVLSDTPARPNEAVTQLPQDAQYWTIKAYDQYGSTIFADPIPLNYLTCTGYEFVSQKRLSRMEFEYHLRMKVKNMGSYDIENITADLVSALANITVLNSKVFFDSIPAGDEALSDDTFIVRIDRSSAVDVNDIIWEISNEMEGDFSGDGQVSFVDFAYLAGKWFQTGMDMPEDLYKNEIIDFEDLAMFIENWLRD